MCQDPAKFDGHRYCGRGDMMYLVCHVISQDHETKCWSNYGWEPPKTSHHPAKFSVQKQCGSGDMMVLVCHVISQYHKIKSHVALWVETPQEKLYCGSRGIFLVCHVVSQDHVTKK